MKHQTIMCTCLSAQTHVGWMGVGKHLKTCVIEKGECGLKILEDQNTLIEQSVKA